MSFVHLRVHSEFSITDSVIRVEPPKRKGAGAAETLTSSAAMQGFSSIALTDQSNLFAAVKFVKAAKADGIKPLVGADIWVAGIDSGLPHRLTVFIQNSQGYALLSHWLSEAYLNGQSGARGSKPCVPLSLVQAGTDGLIALSGWDGEIAFAASRGSIDGAIQAAEQWSALFADRFYLEVSRCGRAMEEEWCYCADAMGRLMQLPLVATNDVRFLRKEEFPIHEARTAIARGQVLGAETVSEYTPEQYLKSPDEMAALFADMPHALANTVELASRCSLSMKFGEALLPKYPVPYGQSVAQFLRREAGQGLERRLTGGGGERDRTTYVTRLEHELDVIESMGFEGYFLVVADFIRWSKNNGVPVGPGRGSGAGSLVAYALGITDLDPLPYSLLFERFLNKDRVSLPDFDVDFCMEGRERVIDYVSRKYGRDHVGQIMTYSTMAARGVVRDTVRVLGLPYGFGDRIAKMIPSTPGATLAESIEEVHELRQMYTEDQEARSVLDMARSLEGLTRGVGVHAGGVVISPGRLEQYTPLFCEPGGAGLRSQFDMKDLESIGLVKFDFLGLKTLTVIERALRMIEKRTGTRPALDSIPMDDATTYSLYAAGRTTAVFQMESAGMQRASIDLKPDRFEDLIALISLYRPGPMELIPEYVQRKWGRSPVEYLHPLMEEALAPTFGIFVYQEQVMQVAQRLAGYSLSGADLLRRAMGKKKPDEMAKQRAVFIAGCLANGIHEACAGAVFDQMERFANYGFNKSHAAAYALVSYQTAWLKAHYPAEFMAAVMTCEVISGGDLAPMVAEAQRMGLNVALPDINTAEVEFTASGTRDIQYGLSAIKGIGVSVVEPIVAARREGGPFKSLADCCERLDAKRLSKKTLETLIGAGALDSLGSNRQSLLQSIQGAMDLAGSASRAKELRQGDMFGFDLGNQLPSKVETVWPEMPALRKLQIEHEALGAYLSGHPLRVIQSVADQVCDGSLGELIERASRRTTRQRGREMFAAIVIEVKPFRNESSRIELTDQSGARIGAWIDNPSLHQMPWLKPGAIAFVAGTISYKAGKDGQAPEPRLHDSQFFSLDQVMTNQAQEVTLDIRGAKCRASDVDAILKPRSSHQGAVIQIIDGEAQEQVTAYPNRVKLSPDMAYEINIKLGALDDGSGRMKMMFRRYVDAPDFDQDHAFVVNDDFAMP